MDERTLKIYKEGMLSKRQRGLHKSSTKKLSFQERFCRLTSQSLDYYHPDPRKRGEPKGQFAVEQLRLIEILEPETFGGELTHLIQIGDYAEVMYLAARTEGERDEWVDAFRKAASEASNKMLANFHHGVYGLVNKGRWSCCANPQRTCQGCSPVPKREELTRSYPGHDTHPSPPKDRKLRSETLPFEPTSPPPTTPLLSEKEPDPPSTPSLKSATIPLIVRSFTMADPVMQRPNLKKLKERMSKALELDDLTIVEKSEEQEEETHKGNEDRKTERIVENGKGDNDLGELNKIAQELQGNEGGGTRGTRSGASSPCPSIDSGKGTSTGSSRPSSQVIHPIEGIDNMRAGRSDSLGKKSNLSVQSDQGDSTDNGQHSPKAPHSPKVHHIRHTKDETDGFHFPLTSTNDNHTPELRRKKDVKDELEVKKTPDRTRRKLSSPPRLEDDDQNRTSTPDNETPTHRPVSVASSMSLENFKRFSIYGPDSGGYSPIHRTSKLYSPHIYVDEEGRLRPRSMKLPSCSIIDGEPTIALDEFNRLQRACKEGNMSTLKEELNALELANLEEPSSGAVPYTPLFLAFLNDHYQTMLCLLEHGANPDCIEPVSKSSILHVACERRCTDIVELLIKYNANVNLRDLTGCTPLMEACKHGYVDIAKILINNGAEVDQEGVDRRTSLHEASEAGHSNVTQLLIEEGGADPIARDDNDSTPYDLAFMKGHKEVMRVLQNLIPEQVRPYSLVHSQVIPSAQMVTSLAFKGTDTLVSGSRDCQACFWDTDTLSMSRSVRVSDTVLDVDVWSKYLAIASTAIQLINIENFEWRRTVADDTHEDESLVNPPLHLVAFGPKGRLVTAGVESNIVKLWPPPSPQAGLMIVPDASLSIGEDQEQPGCVYSLSISPTPNCPWLAVGMQPGTMFSAVGNKLVYLLDWETRELHEIFDAGDGGLGVSVHTMFSPDGQQLAIGCSENLCIWETKSGELLYKFTIPNGAHITSICYSPDGGHLSAGLSTGEIEVFEVSSSSPIFILEKPKDSPAAVTSLAYSDDGKLFAVGHANGSLRLWEGRATWLSVL